MVSIKPGVNIAGISPEMVIGCLIVSSVFSSFHNGCVITSVKDGKHMQGSRHDSGNAVDFRIREIESKTVLLALVNEVQRSLGSQYDVILEKDHLHVEFDPK